ncbi:MAG: DUF928 domain-containing protein [Cyanobacteriota bacterium]|nr:DUF928 domain-containing protein [Cyanobacteriota bacterium]
MYQSIQLPFQLPFQLVLGITPIAFLVFSPQPGMASLTPDSTTAIIPVGQHSIALTEPESPDTGTPQGDRTVGGTRPETTCKPTQKPLTALFANNGSDLTLSAHPTFLFYIPYEPTDISTIEFLLLDRSERRTIYRTTLRLIDRPGIVRVSLPEVPEYALEAGETYRWRLNLDCMPDRTVDPDLVLNGWVRRVSLDTPTSAASPLEEYQFYRDNGIWYDAIERVAQLHFANPDDGEVDGMWTELWNRLELDWAIEEPLVASEVLSEE